MISKSDYECIIRNAKLYKNNLSGSNVIFVYENRQTKEYEYCEVVFKASNFKHLTGINYLDNSNSGANHFILLAFNQRLNIQKCSYKADGTTQLKLRILSMIMNITKSARMIGTYNNSKLHISADKMCGSTAATLAFVRNNKQELCPSSALQEDIRNLVTEYHTVVAVFQKKQGNEFYELWSSSKRYDENKISDDMRKKINK